MGDGPHSSFGPTIGAAIPLRLHFHPSGALVSQSQGFSSRTAMMLAMLSMAVGTGNIWRFPRIAATNGGGEFLVAWVICLFTWSIPLILVEFGMGRMTRLGPIGAFVRTQGKKSAWMGAFIAFVAVAIMAYYSVVTGWTLRYAIAAGLGEVTGENSVSFWRTFSTTTAPVVIGVRCMCSPPSKACKW